MPQMGKALGFATDQRVVLVIQLLATVAALAWVPGNAVKLLTMIVIWAVGFRRLSGAELALVGCINVIFVLMDIATLHRGSFRFTQPDLLGLPFYEFFMWGFYVLNAIRFFGPEAPSGAATKAIGLAILFALPFSLVQDYRALLISSAAVLLVSIGFFHHRRDIAFVGYMIGVGAIIEYAGVWSGQWAYDGRTLGGVPLWFVTMWGGIGLFTHRLALPLTKSIGK